MIEVSIIVPIYNIEKYLERCIDSILSQTFTNFELILVDDGSPDNCPEICDLYALKDSRIKVIHKKNGGLADARNAGLNITQGKYIAFCDGDDYVSNTWIEHFMNAIHEKKDNYIFCGFDIVNSEHFINDKKNMKIENSNISNFIKLQSQNKIGFAWNAFYYADIIEKYNIRFSKDLIVEDLPFTLEYLSHLDLLTFTGSSDYKYFQDDRETLSKKYYPNGFEKWKEKYEITKQFINSKIDEEERDELIITIANSYLYQFLHALNNTFDNRNHWNLVEKYKYNREVIKNEVFQDCLRYADCSNENNRYIRLLKNKHCFLAFLLQYITEKRRK